MPLTPGQVLNNRYRIVKLLGQGGFGAVYRAWDMSKRASCAVKENLDTSTAARNQFEREAQLLFGLSHPNLPRVFDLFTIPGQGQYLVMDFVEGQNLDDMVTQRGPLPEAQALDWIWQACDALSYMHSLNPAVIHRDIKPANIVITPQNKAMLVDFGIAKAYNPQLKTSTGARAVTPGYSPLEQYGTGTTDARSDIYALAATLYTLLTGQVPPEAPGRSLNDTLVPAWRMNPNVSQAVSIALTQALHIRQDMRQASMSAFAAALRGLPPAPPTIKPAQTTQSGRRIPIWAMIAGVVLGLFVCLGLGWGGWSVVSGLVAEDFTPTVDLDRILTETALAGVVEDESTPEPTWTATIPSRPPPTLTFTLFPEITLPTLTFTLIPDTQTPLPPTEVPFPGGLIAFNSNRNGNNDIYVMNSDGSGVKPLTFSPASETVPAWSPDGRYLSFQSDEAGTVQIYVIDLQSGQIRQVTNMACSNWAPSWSPDGKTLVFYSDCDGSLDIYTMNVNGGNRQRITSTTNGNNKFPVWSPDGRKILYASFRSSGYQIVEMNRDGNGLRIITAGCVCAYSPDGEWIVFSQYCKDLGKISKIQVDGSDETELDSQYGNTNPSWSNDGHWIVFQSDRSGNEDIWVMDADGNNWRQLTDHPARDSAAVWQPVR